MYRTRYVLALAVALLPVAAKAQDYVVDVNGIVCEFCSLGVAKKVGRLPFVDRSKYEKGVSVDAERQRVTLAVKENEALDVSALFAAIESAGYNPIEVFTLDDGGNRSPYRP